jgi:ubiquinone/menaquinone biosynthesis C-methylase UbiE
MADQLVFDEEAAREIESMYFIDDAVRRRAIVRERLAAQAGERIVDVGCGPGFYCAELADEVGAAGSIVGVDGSAAMLALAERRCAAFPNVELREGDALAIPAEDGSFDAALSVQVQEYVPDIEASLRELRRVLRPGGRVLIYDIDWATLSIHSEERERNARVMRAWDEHLAHASLPTTLPSQLQAAGFDAVEMTAHAFATHDFDRSKYYGPALVPFIGTFVVGREGLSEADARAWVDEQRRLGERGEFYFAVTQFCFTARAAGT